MGSTIDDPNSAWSSGGESVFLAMSFQPSDFYDSGHPLDSSLKSSLHQRIRKNAFSRTSVSFKRKQEY